MTMYGPSRHMNEIGLLGKAFQDTRATILMTSAQGVPIVYEAIYERYFLNSIVN
jgi:hypothetical protein